MSSFETLEHIGPLSRSVRDAALMLSVVSGPDARDRHSLPPVDFDWLPEVERGCAGLRVAFSPDFGRADVAPEVRRIVERAAQVFADQIGCEVEAVTPAWPDPFEQLWALVAGDSDLAGMRKLVEQHGGSMSPHIVEMVQHD